MVRRGFGESGRTDEARMLEPCNGCILSRADWTADILRGRSYADEHLLRHDALYSITAADAAGPRTFDQMMEFNISLGSEIEKNRIIDI